MYERVSQAQKVMVVVLVELRIQLYTMLEHYIIGQRGERELTRSKTDTSIMLWLK